jgi:hypothetical protein
MITNAKIASLPAQAPIPLSRYESPKFQEALRVKSMFLEKERRYFETRNTFIRHSILFIILVIIQNIKAIRLFFLSLGISASAFNIILYSALGLSFLLLTHWFLRFRRKYDEKRHMEMLGLAKTVPSPRTGMLSPEELIAAGLSDQQIAIYYSSPEKFERKKPQPVAAQPAIKPTSPSSITQDLDNFGFEYQRDITASPVQVLPSPVVQLKPALSQETYGISSGNVPLPFEKSDPFLVEQYKRDLSTTFSPIAQKHEQPLSPGFATYPSYFSPTYSPSIESPRFTYRPSPVRKPTPKATSPMPSTNNEESPNNPTYKKAIEKLLTLDVTPVLLHKWADNIRKWMHDMMLVPLETSMNQVNDALKARNLRLYDCNYPLDNQITTEHLANIPNDVIPMGTGSVTLRSVLRSLLSKDPNDQIIKNRINLENYLTMPTNRSYLVNRLSELVNKGFLTVYKWDSGCDFEGIKWSESGNFPTDAQVLHYVNNNTAVDNVPSFLQVF